MIPHEAIAAFKLLWGYYLCHVVFITLGMWVIYVACDRLSTAMLGTLLMLFLVFLVEIVQMVFPVLGDPSLDDIVVGTATVLVCFIIFSTIKKGGPNGRNDTKKTY